MFPPFDNRGYLPPGIHRCTIDELAERFGHGSPERLVEMSELREFFAWCRQMGIGRALINGSFTTSKVAPNDVDVVVLLGEDDPSLEKPRFDDDTRWPFLHIMVTPNEEAYQGWATVTFASDRRNRPKGIVEVML